MYVGHAVKRLPILDQRGSCAQVGRSLLQFRPFLLGLKLEPQPNVYRKLVRPIDVVRGDHVVSPSILPFRVIPQVGQPVHPTPGVMGQRIIDDQAARIRLAEQRSQKYLPSAIE